MNHGVVAEICVESVCQKTTWTIEKSADYWRSLRPTGGSLAKLVNRTFKWPSFARWRHEALHAALNTILMAARQLKLLNPLRLPVTKVSGKVGAHVPKAQKLKRRVWQTDRQTNFLRIIVR